MVEKRRILETDVEQPTKKSKYNNKRVLLTDSGTILKPEHIQKIKSMGLVPTSGEAFDSELEAVYYRDVLLPRVLAGEIVVQRQPKFVLLPEFTKDGQTFRAIHYVADFLVNYADGRIEAIDVKGFADSVFLLKRKLFDAVYPDIKLLVLKRVNKYGGWITTEEYAQRKKMEKKQMRALERPQTVKRSRGKP